MCIHGITIQLHNKVQTGTDPFGVPVYGLQTVDVHDVLVSPMSETEVLETLNLTGKKAVYQLAIPKTDANVWEDQYVSFFGETWRVVGKPIKGIEAMMPLKWNAKVRVESIDGKKVQPIP